MQQALHAIGFLALAHALQQFFKLRFRQPLKAGQQLPVLGLFRAPSTGENR
jgi:hypothetical protein